MVDPVTAIGVATKAFASVKALVSAGRDMEDCLGQLGAWYGAISDLNEADRQASNPPLFKTIVNKTSVEQEALKIFTYKKKVAAQEAELRSLLTLAYGVDSYRELIQLRKDVRKEREMTIYKQARRRKEFFWQSLSIFFLVTGLYLIYVLIQLIRGNMQ